jgi:hypothetical protein
MIPTRLINSDLAAIFFGGLVGGFCYSLGQGR